MKANDKDKARFNVLLLDINHLILKHNENQNNIRRTKNQTIKR